MGNSNVGKSRTLGMPHGTACNKLRKQILFHLLIKLGENKCFKCSEIIEKVADLSIEHKQPWEGISADLFWDLNNIAFSHLHCNRPHRQPLKKYFTEEEKNNRKARENSEVDERKLFYGKP